MSKRMQVSIGEECPDSLGGTGVYLLIPQITKNYRYVGGIYNRDGELLAVELEFTLKDAEVFYRMYTKALEKGQQLAAKLKKVTGEKR